MIPASQVEHLHKILIDTFGGSHGIRDKAALQSALDRPFQSFEGDPLYPTVLHQAAALVESLLTNHPFIDGNKRVGYTVLRLFLLANDLDISASQDNKYEFVINIASGTLKFDEILSWLSSNTKPNIGA
jgi:death-on-curing protein